MTLTANRIASTSPDNETNLVQAFDSAHNVANPVAAGAIGIKEGKVFIGGGVATALTLVAPTAGLPAAGGDDGKKLEIVAVTAHAHTVTTPATKINGADDTVTFAAVGDWVELTAYNGIWYAKVGGPTPAALSEV
jgi:hypothetical protein